MFNVITIFPGMFSALTGYGITSRGFQGGFYRLNLYNPRDFCIDNYRRVDDRPFGGGEGMVMMIEPLVKALRSIQDRGRVIYLSPQGKVFDQGLAREYLSLDTVTFICGRYEGVDQRFIDNFVSDEVSIGDFVMSGGELAAMVVLDCMIRQIPNLIKEGSCANESFCSECVFDYPTYTRPRDFEGLSVPEILLSGDHSEIRKWRSQKANSKLKRYRPDLA